MSAKNWSFFYNKEQRQEVKQNILDTVSLWGAIGLLWYAFVTMIGEHFPEFLQGLDWRIILLWQVVLWLGYEWPTKYLKKWVLLCRLAGMGIPVFYILINFEKIIDGFLRLLEIYLPFVNAYYQTDFYVTQSNTAEHLEITFTVLCIVLWWIAWMLAMGFKKKILLALFPLAALALELAVGLSPMGNGLLFLLFGVVFLATMGGSSVVKKAVVLASVGLSVFLSGLLFGDDIQSLATKEQKQTLLNWQENFSLTNLFQLDFHFNWEQLNNNSPQYTGKVMLEIEADGLPGNTIYLRGFYATTYENGNWKYDDSFFKQACKEADISETEAAKYLFNRPYSIMAEESDLITYKIKSVGSTGDVAYAPYYSNYETFDEAYTLMGDFLLKKSIWDNEVVVTGIKDRVNMLNFIQSVEGSSGDWYNGLAAAYLEVPEDMTVVKEATRQAIRDPYLYSGEDVWDERGNLLANTRSSSTRMDIATAIAKYLKQQMSYSLLLDDLPSDSDPIEYALSESHEGYCMHFASAATLMLREAGVPARYVSGYVINPSEFDYVDEIFRAEVTDYDAHAWVEIYLEDIGWMPVEVTPGYDSSESSRPTEMDPAELEEQSQMHREELEKEESNVPGEKPLETEDTEGTENTEENSQGNSVENQDSEDGPGNSSQNSNNNPGNLLGIGDGSGTGSALDGSKLLGILLALFKVLGIILIVIAVIAAFVLGVRQWLRRYVAVLNAEIRKNLTRKAVKRMNRRIYRILCIQTPRFWFAGKMTDGAYKQALIESFAEVSTEDWERYMEIVKKNHYSNEEISTEEMQLCYSCYEKVKLFNISLTKLWNNKN